VCLDLEHLNRDAINASRKRWREQVLADPRVLYSRIGPEIVCTAPAVTVRLVAFGEDAPLRFDVNTVQEGILRLVPGIGEEQIARWTAERARSPFSSAEDFRRRVGSVAGMKF
jgi:predicted nucleic acid-binding OB-fold protein